MEHCYPPTAHVILIESPLQRLQLRPLRQAIALPHRKLAADEGAPLVDAAEHGGPVQGGAPAVVAAGHDPAAPGVLLSKNLGHVVVAHQHHLQPAAAGLAGGTGDGGGFDIVHGRDGRPAAEPSPGRQARVRCGGERGFC